MQQPDSEPDELTRFREEWKAEVRAKRAPQQPNVQSVPSSSSVRPKAATATTPVYTATAPVQSDPPRISQLRTNISQGLADALLIYRQAINHEERGELDQALLLYRQAFRREPQVDKLYRKEQLISAVVANHSKAATVSTSKLKSKGQVDLEEMTHQMSTLSVKNTFEPVAIVTGQLAKLVSTFPDQLIFEPEDDTHGSPLKDFPNELIIDILRLLDPTSIERFALASRKARVLTLDSVIWRELVSTTYKPPQVPDEQAIDQVVNKFSFDYRRVFIEHPRVRTDGVYIAVCHYIRHGLGENAWINMTHLITYHRFLFFPNGQVLSLLANEEIPPGQIIHLLKPSLRMKGLFLGTWHLSDTAIHLSNLIDASGRFSLPTELSSEKGDHNVNLSASEFTTARYIFNMTLSLRSPIVGRWNKLNITSYDSVNVETGDSTPVILKHERPFWFSKVKSYASMH